MLKPDPSIMIFAHMLHLSHGYVLRVDSTELILVQEFSTSFLLIDDLFVVWRQAALEGPLLSYYIHVS